MGIKSSLTHNEVSCVNTYINSAYDTVKSVADNLDEIISLAQYVDDFNLYLGPHDSPPTTDNLGNPLREGATYWNTETDLLYYWNGSVWVENTSVLVTQEFVVPLTDGQTIVTAPRSMFNVILFVLDSLTGNERLVKDVDYTVGIDNLTVTLNESYNSGSELYFVFNDTDNSEGLTSWTSGIGSPEGVVNASVGSLYTRKDGGAGTTLYIKELGTGNTGWAAK